MKGFSLLCSLLFAGMSEMRSMETPAFFRHLVGREFTYSMRPGDSFASVGARFGVDPPVLAKQNGLSTRATIRAGRVLRIDNRHIVPAVLDNGILINVPQRLLFLFESGNVVAWYSVGLAISADRFSGAAVASAVKNPARGRVPSPEPPQTPTPPNPRPQ